ncbi:MAG: glycosyltransferase [Candidatus Anstonellaceae archaeon]
MPSKKPLVSVLMPFYDDGSAQVRRHFSEALSSVLSQTFKNFEAVVVVSGKTDFAKKLAKRSKKTRVFFFNQPPFEGKARPLSERLHGIVTARNVCVSKARGELLAFADYDDISLPGRLETQVKFLQSHRDIGAVGSSMILIDKGGAEVGLRSAFETDEEIRKHFLQFNPVPQPTVMVRKRLVEQAGCYREGEFSEDYDLWVRMAKITKFHNISSPLVKYRVHPGGGASRYRLQLYFSSLSVKWRAMGSLRMVPTPADFVVNMLQFISLFFPDSLRRTFLEKLRSKFVVRRDG